MEGQQTGQEPGAPTGTAAVTAPVTQSAGTTPVPASSGTTSAATTPTTATTQAAGLPSELPTTDSEWNALPVWVRNLRQENASRRVGGQTLEQELATAQARVTELEQADMTELQKLQATVNNMNTVLVPALKTTNRNLQVQLVASDLGVVDPEAVVKLLDWQRIERGEDTKVVVTDLLAAKPYLRKQDSTNGTTATQNGGTTGTDGTVVTPTVSQGTAPASTTSTGAPASPARGSATRTFSRAELDKMPAEEIVRLLDEGGLQEAIQEGRITD